jgi:hypothetical protein
MNSLLRIDDRLLRDLQIICRWRAYSNLLTALAIALSKEACACLIEERIDTGNTQCLSREDFGIRN